MGEERPARWARIALPVLWLVLPAGGPARAFHDGGAADCQGCHIMHEGAVLPSPSGADGSLLIAESPSDVCLTCHAEDHGAVLGLDPLLPPPERGAGNFVFLWEDNLNDAPDGATDPIPGEAAGHSIVAPGRGLVVDSRNPTAPGGTFPSDRLGCTSCHDPHGNANFRMLYGAGPVQNGLFTFASPAPAAEGIDLAGGPETNSHHSAYRNGMSAWCGNCHGNYHDGAGSGFEHPSGESLGTGISNRYNRYNGDDDPMGGDWATAYLAAVPFEDNSTATDSTAGTASTSRVICLTCHRAHASSAPRAGRWDFNVTLLRNDGVVSGSWPIPDPYDSPNQGPLCSKCHSGIPGGGGP